MHGLWSHVNLDLIVVLVQVVCAHEQIVNLPEPSHFHICKMRTSLLHHRTVFQIKLMISVKAIGCV